MTTSPPCSIPGSYARPWSLRPLLNAKKFVYSLGAFLGREKRRAGNAPVFRTHAGWRLIACTDHASTGYVLRAARSQMERMNHGGFGPVIFRRELMGPAAPTLTAWGGEHDRARALTDAVLRARSRDLTSSFEQAFAAASARWVEEGAVELYAALQELCCSWLYRWLFGAVPDLGQLQVWQEELMTVATDSRLCNAVARRVLPKLSSRGLEAHAHLRRTVSESPHYPRYVSLAEEHGVDPEHLPELLNVMAAANGIGAVARTVFPSLAQLSVSPAAEESLRAELEGAEVTAEGLAPLSYLDATMWECLRLYPRPPYIFRTAAEDFVLPAGDGRHYQVRRGESLMAVLPFAQRDPAVFKEPETFDPQRFLETPELEDQVYSTGRATDSRHPYGCAAFAADLGATAWKLPVAAFLKKLQWRLETEPALSLDYFYYVEPEKIRLLDVATA